MYRIDPDGKVTEVKLIKGLGYGLDEVAVEAVKNEFNTVRSGRASVGLLDRIDVDY